MGGFTNIRPIEQAAPTGEFTNIRPIGGAAAPSTTPPPASTTAAPQPPGALQRFGTGAIEEAKGLAKGIGGAISEPPQGHLENALSLMGRITGTEPLALKRLLVDPAIAKGKSTVDALKSGEWMKAGLGAAATINPMAPDVTKLYKQAQAGDTAGAMGRGATDIFAMKGVDLVRGAAKLIERAPTLEQGKIGYINTARGAISKLDNAVRNSGVGTRAKQVEAADAVDLARSGSNGKVNGVAATKAMQDVIDQNKIGGVAHGFNSEMSMSEAKGTMTQLGREASRLARTGKAPEAASVWAAYDALREETMNRAKQLDTMQPGAGHAQAWGDYAKEFRNYLGLQEGVLGHLTEGEHTTSLNKLIEHSGQLPELKKWFDKYKIDFSPIKDAAKQGKVLNDLSVQTSSAFVGKIKAIQRHFFTAGPAVAGAAMLGHASGIPGAGFILPLLVAGKVAGLLDHIQIHSLLTDLGKRIPPEMMQVSGDPLGPYQPKGGSAGPSAPATTGLQPPSGTVGGGVGESELEMERRRPSGTPAPTETVGETTGPDLNQELAEQQDLAQKLQHARKGRK